MSGSVFGKCIKVSTFGESHGKAIGAIVDGIPAGLEISEEYIQTYLDRRKPGQSKYTTARNESDMVEILSGTFEGKTTGTPISLLIKNGDHHSADYDNIKDVFRPGHGDYTYHEKYGFRDYRGGGRASGRETAARVAAGAICAKLLETLGVKIFGYTESIGTCEVSDLRNLEERDNNPFYMPDPECAKKTKEYVDRIMADKDSVGGVVSCIVSGLPVGLGEPVFDKLDARLASAMLSIGAAKGFEIGMGFASAISRGSMNNDGYAMKDGRITHLDNNSGGVLAGISDGKPLVFKVAFKPTPSIARPQKTVDIYGNEKEIVIQGRHDPVIVPRAVVVVEMMAAMVLADLVLCNATSKMDYIKQIYAQ